MIAAHAVTSRPTVAATSFRIDRIAGFAGLAFAIIVAFVNVLVGSMSPPALDASGSEVATFITENRTALGIATGIIPFGVAALFLFVSAAFPRLSQVSGEAALWARFGAIGIVLVEVMFLARTLFEVALIANVDRLAQEPMLVETLWRLQGAGQIFTGLALAIALTGLSRAARLGGLIPRWQEMMGYGAALAFFVAVIASVPSLKGSPIGLLGLVAFVTWLAWLALTSVRFLRVGSAQG